MRLASKIKELYMELGGVLFTVDFLHVVVLLPQSLIWYSVLHVYGHMGRAYT